MVLVLGGVDVKKRDKVERNWLDLKYSLSHVRNARSCLVKRGTKHVTAHDACHD